MHGNSCGQLISRREESQPRKVLLWALAGCSGITRRAGRLKQRKWVGSSRGGSGDPGDRGLEGRALQNGV